jgi:ABC-2 type transport system permease protein
VSPPSIVGQARLVAALDLRRRLRDRSVLIQVFLAPVVLALIIGGAFGGGAGGIEATIWLGDADQTPSTSAAVAAVTAGTADGGVALVARPGLDAPAAREAVDAGTADAAIVVPAGFTAAVEAGDPAKLLVVGDAGAPIAAAVATSVAQRIADQAQAHRVTVATVLEAAGRSGVPVAPEEVAALSASAPAAVSVTDARFEDGYSLMAFFAPGMAMIFLFFVMGAAARSVLTERREGTLPRMLAGPASIRGILLGKTLAVITLGLTGMLTVWGITSVGFGVDWGDPLGVALVILGAVIAVAGISLVITGLARDEQQSEALTIVFSLAFAVLGGSFIYSGVGFLAAVRPFTPNGLALTAFTELAAARASALEVLPTVLTLLAIGAATGAVGLLAIRKGLER